MLKHERFSSTFIILYLGLVSQVRQTQLIHSKQSLIINYCSLQIIDCCSFCVSKHYTQCSNIEHHWDWFDMLSARSIRK